MVISYCDYNIYFRYLQFARKRKVAILKAQNKTLEAIEELNKYLKQ